MNTMTEYRIDGTASHVQFEVAERMAFVKRRTDRRRFAEISGTIALDARHPTRSRVELAIDAAAIDTGDARRDKNLRGGHFFDAERCPRMTFSSRAIEVLDVQAGRFRVAGDLTVRGVTREVDLDVDCDLNEAIVRVVAATVLNRRDFGMTYGNAVMWIGDGVRVRIELAAVPHAAAVAA